jgi:hypothetical protein
MDIKVMGLRDAFDYITDKPTYAIRISSFWTSFAERSVPLRGDYRVIREYVFDDIGKNGKREYNWYEPNWWINVKRFDKDIAERIIKDFIEGRDGCERLLIHCHKGKSRGPAIARALNEIFSLGWDGKSANGSYMGNNKLVYETLIETAKKMGVYNAASVPAL